MEGITKIDLERKELILNGLENGIMGHLWTKEEATTKEIYNVLGKKDIAPTTIVVTLDRLYSKGLVERRIEKGKGGLHYVYSFKISKEDLGRNLSLAFADRMIAFFGPAVASYFSKEALEKLKKQRRKR